MTAQHQWVKHVITPVTTLTDEEGKPVVLVDPDDQVISEDNAVYGCGVCMEAMATHHDKPCEGAPID